MARSLLFYGVILALAAALVLLSLGPRAFGEPEPVRQAGVLENGALMFGPAALFGVEASEPVDAVSPARRAGQPVGLRIAAEIGAGAPGPADRGVRVLLAPEAAQALGAGPVQVDLVLEAIGPNRSERLAVSLQDMGPVEWRVVDVPLELPATVTVELPPSALGLPPDAIGLRAVHERTDYASGVQINAMRVRPLAATPTP